MSGTAENGGESELALAHRALLGVVRGLEAAMDDATTPARVAELSDQIVEANTRATRIGAKLLVEQTAEIAQAARALGVACAEIQSAIDNAEDQRRLVAGVARLLRVADQAIATVERVA